MKFKTVFKSLRKALLVGALVASLSVSTVTTSNAAVLGIDVSKYNGAIDWNAVASAGVAFTFIKAGSTNSGVDPQFVNNITNAQAAGIRTGVYIYSYAMSVEEAVNEANLLLEWIAPYGVNFPVAFDIESRAQSALDPATITAMCNAFCDVINNAGYYPIVYTYKNFFKGHMTSDLRYDYWIAQYKSETCDIGGYSVWQYSSTGSIPGISGAVDLNWMVKDFSGVIIKDGFAQHGDYVFFYQNYLMQRGWVTYNGARYHMDDNGHMNTGWFSDASGTYYLSTVDGHAAVGLVPLDADTFYFDEEGRICNGYITIADQKYYFDPTNGCRMYKGWLTDSTGVHYLSLDDGHMVTGAALIDGKNYLFNTDGNMLTGWQTVNGQTYYYSPENGAMVTGWVGDTANRYYLSLEDGHRVSGMVTIDGKNYYFDPETGKMQVGMIPLGDTTYYFDPNTGAMITGFVGDLTNRYYFNITDGRMVKGTAQIDGATYYFDTTTGKMQLGWQVLGGLTYYFDPATGKMITGWIRGTEATYYTATDGHLITDQALTIEDHMYVFNTEGRLCANMNYTIGTTTYSCDANGYATVITQ
ncbi:MAG: hypothetical protein K6G23_00465 [Lachnospiraceae bacterium]|nr:hypothetical protein [Lachnospiraceae bacterium]